MGSMTIPMVASHVWRWLRHHPFFAGLWGAAAGCAAYWLFNLASSFAWVREQGGLAGWLQAIGTIVAVWWGFETARRQRSQQLQELHDERCRNARASVSLAHKSLELLADRLNVAAHPGETVLSLREFRTTEMITALREIDLSHLPAEIVVPFAEVRSGIHAVNSRISEIYKSEEENRRTSERGIRLISSASTFQETCNSYNDLVLAAKVYSVEAKDFQSPARLKEFLRAAIAGELGNQPPRARRRVGGRF